MSTEFSKREDWQQMWLAANTQANEFARTGLAHLILLNGGAILAFAPIGALFEVKVSTAPTLVLVDRL